MPTINPSLLAFGTQGTQPTAQGLLGDVQQYQQGQQQNKLMSLNNQTQQANLDEFNAGAGNREDARVRASLINSAINALPYLEDDARLLDYAKRNVATICLLYTSPSPRD